MTTRRQTSNTGATVSMPARLVIVLLSFVVLCGAQSRSIGYQKPSRGAVVQRGHPLARGLIHCWVLNEFGGEPRDIVSGEWAASVSDPAWGAGAWSFDGAADYSDLLAIPPALNDFTFVLIGRVNVMGPRYSRVVEHASNTAGWSVSKEFEEGDDYRYNLDGIVGVLASIDVVNNSQYALWVVRRIGGDWDLSWLPLVANVPSLRTPGGITGSSVLGTAAPLRVAEFTGGGAYYTGMSVLAVYYYDRFLTDVETESLRRSPYQFLRSPYTRRLIAGAPVAPSAARRRLLIFNFLLWLNQPNDSIGE